MNKTFFGGLMACLCAVTIWGAQFPIAKDVFIHVDSFHVTLIRYLVAAMILTPILIFREGLGVLRFDGRPTLVASMGAMGMSFSPLMVFYGVSIAGAEHGSVVVALQPTIMMAVQWIFFKKRPARFTLLCIVIAFLGVVLVVTGGGGAHRKTADAVLGSVLILAGGFCWIYYTLGTERLRGWSVLRITVLTILCGTVANLIVTGVLVRAGWVPSPAWADYRAVAPQLSFLGICGVSISMLAWNFGTRRVGPLNSMLLSNMMPVVTFTYRAVQGYRFESVEIVGAGIVVLSLVANNVYLRRQFMRGSR